MPSVCEHSNQRPVLDMPLADSETFEFLGRFDVVFCPDCEEILDKKPTTYAEENTVTVTPETSV